MFPEQPKKNCAEFFLKDFIGKDGKKHGKLYACKIKKNNNVKVKSDLEFSPYYSGLRCQFKQCKDYAQGKGAK